MTRSGRGSKKHGALQQRVVDSRIEAYGTLAIGLMRADLITLPHFSVSSAISFPNSAGEPGSAVPPRSARRAFILGAARPALISLLSFSMISAGVFFGAPKPHH